MGRRLQLTKVHRYNTTASCCLTSLSLAPVSSSVFGSCIRFLSPHPVVDSCLWFLSQVPVFGSCLRFLFSIPVSGSCLRFLSPVPHSCLRLMCPALVSGSCCYLRLLVLHSWYLHLRGSSLQHRTLALVSSFCLLFLSFSLVFDTCLRHLLPAPVSGSFLRLMSPVSVSGSCPWHLSPAKRFRGPGLRLVSTTPSPVSRSPASVFGSCLQLVYPAPVSVSRSCFQLLYTNIKLLPPTGILVQHRCAVSRLIAD